jgi:dTDP-4-amino-4,6-dideoxygalactose transaminase
MNLRMHPYSASLVAHQLDTFEQQLKERRETAEFIHQRLGDVPGLRRSRVPAGAVSACYALPLLFDAREWGFSRKVLLEALAAEGAVEADAPGSTRPLDDFALFAESQSAAGDLSSYPRAQEYHATLVKFPTWYGPRRLDHAQAYWAAVEKIAARRDALKARASDTTSRGGRS